jgi:hypothetical protein
MIWNTSLYSTARSPMLWMGIDRQRERERERERERPKVDTKLLLGLKAQKGNENANRDANK